MDMLTSAMVTGESICAGMGSIGMEADTDIPVTPDTDEHGIGSHDFA
jgi:hypothetical protein